MISNGEICLRSVEPDDVDLLYAWENDTSVWRVSHTLAPFSKQIIKAYLESSHDIYLTKQVRFVIIRLEDREPIGTVDIFEFDPFHQRAGIGVLIADESDRGNGWGSMAVELASKYAFKTLCLRQLWCNVMRENPSSLRLFKKQGFQEVGSKKDWIRTDDGWKDEILLQKINGEDE